MNYFDFTTKLLLSTFCYKNGYYQIVDSKIYVLLLIIKILWRKEVITGKILYFINIKAEKLL